jgi:hypothetical protein
MPRKITSPEQIINTLRGAEIMLSQGATITVLAKKIGVIVQTYTAGEKRTAAFGWIKPSASRI